MTPTNIAISLVRYCGLASRDWRGSSEATSLIRFVVRSLTHLLRCLSASAYLAASLSPSSRIYGLRGLRSSTALTATATHRGTVSPCSRYSLPPHDTTYLLVCLASLSTSLTQSHSNANANATTVNSASDPSLFWCTSSKVGLDYCADIVVYEVDSRLPLQQLDEHVRNDLQAFAAGQSVSVSGVTADLDLGYNDTAEDDDDDGHQLAGVAGSPSSQAHWSSSCLEARRKLSCTTSVPMCVSRPVSSAQLDHALSNQRFSDLVISTVTVEIDPTTAAAAAPPPRGGIPVTYKQRQAQANWLHLEEELDGSSTPNTPGPHAGWFNTFACRSMCEYTMRECGFDDASALAACTTFPTTKCIDADLKLSGQVSSDDISIASILDINHGVSIIMLIVSLIVLLNGY